MEIKRKHVRSRSRIQEEYRDIVQRCSDGVRKDKTHLEFNVISNTKAIKDFYRYITNKRKTKKNEGPLLNQCSVSGDKKCGKRQGTQCLLHLCLYWQDLSLGIPGP